MSCRCSRILIVDDEPDMGWVIENALASTDYVVKTVIRAAEALDLLAVESYDIALVDAKLPDIDGIELAAIIRGESSNTVVILISGYHRLEDSVIVEGLQNHLFADFIAKPFDIEEIREVIRQAKEGNCNR